MGCLEASGVPVLYIGRTVPKGYSCNVLSLQNCSAHYLLLIILLQNLHTSTMPCESANVLESYDFCLCVRTVVGVITGLG